MLLNSMLRKCIGDYRFTKSQEKINQLMFMDDIKIFTKNKQLETLIQTIGIFSQDIGMEFVSDTCAMVIMKVKIKLPNQKHQNTWQYKRLSVRDIIKQMEMNEKVRK